MVDYLDFVRLANSGYDNAVDRAAQQSQTAQQKAAGNALANGDTTGAANILARSGDLSGYQSLNAYGQQQQTRAARITGATALAGHNYAGAANAAASIGDSAGVESAQNAGIQQFQQQQAYLGRALPVLQAANAKGQLPQAIDTLTPNLKALGATDDQINQWKTAPADQVLGAIGASVQKKWSFQKIGDDTYAVNEADPTDKQLVGRATPKPMALGGGAIYLPPGVDGGGVMGADGSTSTSGGGAPAAVASGAGATRGDRNNNPGNVKTPPQGPWQGQTGVDSQGYAVFDTPANGARALNMQLAAYARHGVTTPDAFVERYAPDSPENEKAAYKARIGAAIGQNFDLSDPATRAQLAPVISLSEGTHLGAQGGAGVGQPRPTPDANGNVQVLSNGGRIIKTKQAEAEDDPDPDVVSYLTNQIRAGLPLPGFGNNKAAAAAKLAAIKQAAQQDDAEGVDGGEANARKATIKAAQGSLNGLTKMRGAVQAFDNTFSMNADQVIANLPGAGPTGSPIFNRWIQAGRRQVQGDPQVTKFDIAVRTAITEYAKIASGATGAAGSSDTAQREASELINKASSPQQLRAAVQQLKIDTANRINGMDQAISYNRRAIATGGRSVSTPATPAAPAVAPAAQPWKAPAGVRIVAVTR